MTELHLLSAREIANGVNSQRFSAVDVTQHFLSRITKYDGQLLSYTHVLHQRAQAKAEEIDKKVVKSGSGGLLAGVPFAVKNLFDIAGITTLAGSKINRQLAPANTDAVLIQRLEQEGAILLGALNMGEFAYDFTGENAHYGNCANPWDTSRMSGGSSSGSGAAVAAGLATLTLGSDTNGSIRVPSSFCGLFGLKPTYGRIPRTGTYPFCDSLDHLGPLARNVDDLASTYDLIQGFDSGDHACKQRDNEPTVEQLDNSISNLRIARASGYFAANNFPQACAAVDKLCTALNIKKSAEIVGVAEGRAAAYLITNAESSRLHLEHLKTQAADFDADTRYRFLAGALMPASWYLQAQRVRHWYKKQFLKVFTEFDILLAPATPCVAPKIGEKTLCINGEDQALRPNLGYFTQPISAIGLPSCIVPTRDEKTGLPIGVQVIAAPWREDLCLRVAKALEKQGFGFEQPTEYRSL